MISDDLDKTKSILEKDGYFESTTPWTFRNVAIELHRFLNIPATSEDPMMIDLLLAKDEEVGRIVQNAVKAESAEGIVILADKTDFDMALEV